MNERQKQQPVKTRGHQHEARRRAFHPIASALPATQQPRVHARHQRDQCRMPPCRHRIEKHRSAERGDHFKNQNRQRPHHAEGPCEDPREPAAPLLFRKLPFRQRPVAGIQTAEDVLQVHQSDRFALRPLRLLMDVARKSAFRSAASSPASPSRTARSRRYSANRCSACVVQFFMIKFCEILCPAMRGLRWKTR